LDACCCSSASVILEQDVIGFSANTDACLFAHAVASFMAFPSPSHVSLIELPHRKIWIGFSVCPGWAGFAILGRIYPATTSVSLACTPREESRPTEGEWIVPLPDDDTGALLTLLNIIHGPTTHP
jgi:hypothetical protein